VGADIQPDLVGAAIENARTLGLSDRFQARILDLNRPDAVEIARRALPSPGGGGTAFDLIMANPPYRPHNEGRLPPSEPRRIALFADEGTLPAFLGTARAALAPGGRLLLIYSAGRLANLLAALRKYGLSPRRVLPVTARPGMVPVRVLVSVRTARQGGLGDNAVSLDPPLILLHERGEKAYTADALAFCPYLAAREIRKDAL
jgi:tRNA1(Val) A37 N6-methylase TrmN6